MKATVNALARLNKANIVTALATLRQRLAEIKALEAEAEAALHETPAWLAYDAVRSERIAKDNATKAWEVEVRLAAARWNADELPQGISQRKTILVDVDAGALWDWVRSSEGNLEMAIGNGLIVIDPRKANEIGKAVKVPWATVSEGREARISSDLSFAAVDGDGEYLVLGKKSAHIASAPTTRGAYVEL